MARYIGPKLKKRQRFGLADASASIRRQGLKPARKTDYGLILEEKQKLKFIYGILERQMRRYAEEAMTSQAGPQVALLQKLESRLDNTVYRLGLAKTREQARQLVSHRHILVDGKRVGIPSYIVQPGQTIAVKEKLLKTQAFKDQMKDARESLSEAPFLLLSEDGGRVLRVPDAKEMPQNVDMAKVLEFYHRKL